MSARLLKENEVLERLGVSRSTLFALRNSGQLGVRRIGRAVRYPEAEIERLIDHGAALPTKADR
jgi:predicted DNA-binding transcriptional regulator AlpA